jgi:hypothetical protein
MANLLSSILNGAKTVVNTLNSATPTSTNTTNPTTQATAPTAYDPTAQINALKQAQIQQNIANLSAKRDTALSSLNAEQAKITPAYYDKRNQTSTASQMQAKNFAEYMANRGLTNSGTSAQAELTRNNTLQGNIGSLNRQELEANQDIERRRTDINNTYASDLASAQAGIESNAMDRLISAQQQAYQNALSQYNTDRTFNYNIGRDAVSDNRYNQQFDYQKSRDAVSDNRYNQEYSDSRADVNYNRDYQKSRDTISDNRYNQEYADNRSDIQYNRDYQKSRDSVSDNQWQQQFDYTKLSNEQKMALDQAQFDFQKEQAAIDNAYRQGTFEWQKAMDSAQLDLQRKQLAITQSKASSSSTNDLGSVAKGNNVTTMAWQSFANVLQNNGTATTAKWLDANKEALKESIGTTEYNRMIDTFAAIQEDTMNQNRANLNTSEPW